MSISFENGFDLYQPNLALSGEVGLPAKCQEIWVLYDFLTIYGQSSNWLQKNGNCSACHFDER
jgi:hypothetical protein